MATLARPVFATLWIGVLAGLASRGWVGTAAMVAVTAGAAARRWLSASYQSNSAPGNAGPDWVEIGTVDVANSVIKLSTE